MVRITADTCQTERLEGEEPQHRTEATKEGGQETKATWRFLISYIVKQQLIIN
jgi:hypothetical protein